MNNIPSVPMLYCTVLWQGKCVDKYDTTHCRIVIENWADLSRNDILQLWGTVYTIIFVFPFWGRELFLLSKTHGKVEYPCLLLLNEKPNSVIHENTYHAQHNIGRNDNFLLVV
mmetsp:Transcript_14056/g.15778  ORF Transcript_14056/g.15778 Transcript_14056/m.15778 type:complete len:113 (+) Transcript_14056:95-433(+)